MKIGQMVYIREQNHSYAMIIREIDSYGISGPYMDLQKHQICEKGLFPFGLMLEIHSLKY